MCDDVTAVGGMRSPVCGHGTVSVVTQLLLLPPPPPTGGVLLPCLQSHESIDIETEDNDPVSANCVGRGAQPHNRHRLPDVCFFRIVLACECRDVPFTVVVL